MRRYVLALVVACSLTAGWGLASQREKMVPIVDVHEHGVDGRVPVGPDEIDLSDGGGRVRPPLATPKGWNGPPPDLPSRVPLPTVPHGPPPKAPVPR